MNKMDVDKFNVGVFVGRCNIPHVGHIKLIEHTRDQSDAALVLIGSAGESRTPKNPLSYKERKLILEEEVKGVTIDSLHDMPDDEVWRLMMIDRIVDFVARIELERSVKVTRISLFCADRSRGNDFELRQAWVAGTSIQVVEFQKVEIVADLSASLVRDLWYLGRLDEVKEHIPQASLRCMDTVNTTWLDQRTPYIKQVNPGDLGEYNEVFIAFTHKKKEESGDKTFLGYTMRADGLLGFVGGELLNGETLSHAVHRIFKYSTGRQMASSLFSFVCTHSITTHDRRVNSHLFMMPVSEDELRSIQREMVTQTTGSSQEQFLCISTIEPDTFANLSSQSWSGAGLHQFHTLSRGLV